MGTADRDLAAIDGAWNEGRYAEVLERIDRRVARAPLDPVDPVGARLLVHRMRALRYLGRLDEAAVATLSAVPAAERVGGELLIDVLDERAHYDGTGGEATLVRAVALAAAVGDAARELRLRTHLADRMLGHGNLRGASHALAEAPGGEDDAYWCHVRGWLALGSDALDEARRWFERGVALARARGGRKAERLTYASRASSMLGGLAFRAGELDRAAAHFREALDLVEGVEFGAYERAQAWNGLGECARLVGELDDAEAAYRAAAEQGAAVGGEVHELNLALVDVERGRAAEASVALRRFLAGTAGRYPALDRPARLALAACAADLGDPAGFDDAFRPFRRGWPGGVAEPEVAHLARRAGARCARRGWSARAVRARRVAIEVWDKVGRPREVEREQRALRRLCDRGAAPQLGPFTLTTPLARGSFGQVWRV